MFQHFTDSVEWVARSTKQKGASLVKDRGGIVPSSGAANDVRLETRMKQLGKLPEALAFFSAFGGAW